MKNISNQKVPDRSANSKAIIRAIIFRIQTKLVPDFSKLKHLKLRATKHLTYSSCGIIIAQANSC